jgi:hypothetical protein
MRRVDDLREVLEVFVLDHGVEAHVVDPVVPQSGNGIEDPSRESRDAASAVVPLIEKVQRDAELIDAGIP